MLSQIRLGRVVWYRSKTGTYTCPATITATVDSLYQPNVEAGHLLPLSGDTYVHLTVDTPGLQGHVSAATAQEHPELVKPDRLSTPAGGTYQEFNIPQWVPDASNVDLFEHSDQPAGTWMWPIHG